MTVQIFLNTPSPLTLSKKIISDIKTSVNEFLMSFLFFLRFRIRIIEFTEKFCYTSTVIFLMLLKM